MTAKTLGLAAAGAVIAGGLWWRKHPSARLGG